MKKAFIIVASIMILFSCKGGGDQQPAAPNTVQESVVTNVDISSPANATYSDGSVAAIRGFKIWISSRAGYSTENLLVLDVGYVSSVPLTQLITNDGTWYVSISEYDSLGESGRQSEIAITRQNGLFHLP